MFDACWLRVQLGFEVVEEVGPERSLGIAIRDSAVDLPFDQADSDAHIRPGIPVVNRSHRARCGERLALIIDRCHLERALVSGRRIPTAADRDIVQCPHFAVAPHPAPVEADRRWSLRIHRRPHRRIGEVLNAGDMERDLVIDDAGQPMHWWRLTRILWADFRPRTISHGVPGDPVPTSPQRHPAVGAHRLIEVLARREHHRRHDCRHRYIERVVAKRIVVGDTQPFEGHLNIDAIAVRQAELALAKVRTPTNAAGDWHGWIFENAVNYREALKAHPNLVPILLQRQLLRIGLAEQNVTVALLAVKGVPRGAIIPLLELLEQMALGSVIYRSVATADEASRPMSADFPHLHELAQQSVLGSDQIFEVAARAVIDAIVEAVSASTPA